MIHRVLLNTKTKYLHITTSDIGGDDLVELFKTESNFSAEINGAHICIQICKVFCLGYLQGNDGVIVRNSPYEFE